METFRAEILPNSLSPFCPPPPPRLSTGRNAVARTGEQTDSRRWPKLMHNGWKNGLWRKKSRRGGGKFVENRWGQSGNRVGNPSRPARPAALRLSPPFSPGFPRPYPPPRAGLPARGEAASRRSSCDDDVCEMAGHDRRTGLRISIPNLVGGLVR